MSYLGSALVTDVLPAPLPVDHPSGAVVWKGGVRVLGPLLIIPGRTLGTDQLDEAEQHALSVLAAVVEQRSRSDDTRG